MEKSENELSNASCEYVYVFIGRVPLFGSPHNRDSSICGLLFFFGVYDIHGNCHLGMSEKWAWGPEQGYAVYGFNEGINGFRV